VSTGAITVLVLTFNEGRHIARCIESVAYLTDQVIVVDSYSTDDTIHIARKCGARTYQNPFVNQAAQFNWALDNTDVATEWVFRLDADEVATNKLVEVLPNYLTGIDTAVAGLTVNRRIHFLGKWIRHGGLYPAQILRIFRYGKGRSEQRRMDEHITVEGLIAHVDADICDINLNDISWWAHKHVGYARREAIDHLATVAIPLSPEHSMSPQSKRRRWVKQRIYYRIPIGARAAIYFLYRYILRAGFLDGWAGFAYHALQGFWYRLLVDLNIYQMKHAIREHGVTLAQISNEQPVDSDKR
jgi:glycosyltransferase involved in cell wall biosynthesis